MSEILDDFREQNPHTSRQRHGCVSAWLIFMLITNSLLVITYFFLGDFILEGLPSGVSPYMLWVLGVLGIVNVFCAYQLLQWKKVGFYGFIGSSILALGVNFYMGLGIGESISGFIGIVLLYGILQIKASGQPAAWDMME